METRSHSIPRKAGMWFIVFALDALTQKIVTGIRHNKFHVILMTIS